MIRILFIGMLSKSESGGSEQLWIQTAVQLIKRGVHVTASVRDDDKPMARHLQLLQSLGADIYIYGRARRVSILTRLIQRIINKIFKVRLDPLEWIRKKRPDFAVITQTGNTDGVEFMEAFCRFTIPYVTIIQSASAAIWPPDFYLERLRAAFLQAIKCFFVSKANLELTQIQLGGEPLNNAEIVRNPFNVSYDAQPLWPEEDVFRLLCLGRIEPFAKGQDLLFQVMNMQKWRDRPVQVACVGAGLNEMTVKQQLRFLNLSNVQIFPFEEDVEKLWGVYHALVLPSRYEGLPLVIVEAMLCGRICIVTDIAGNTELIDDGITGFIAKAPTVVLLDEAMERAWQKRSQWREMGRKAAIAVREIIPREPVSIFCEQLLCLISEQG